VRGEFLVFENMVGNASRIHGGVFKKFMPVIRAFFKAKLLCPFAKHGFIGRRGKHFPLDFAPVAGVVAVFQTELPQAKPLFRAQFFNECSKHNCSVVKIIPQIASLASESTRVELFPSSLRATAVHLRPNRRRQAAERAFALRFAAIVQMFAQR
jgi:hypothetical protein